VVRFRGMTSKAQTLQLVGHKLLTDIIYKRWCKLSCIRDGKQSYGPFSFVFNIDQTARELREAARALYGMIMSASTAFAMNGVASAGGTSA
jgi:hypothetical protein